MASREKLELTTDKPAKRRTNRFWCLVALGVVAALVIFFLGFLIGYFAMKARTSESPAETKVTKEKNRENGESDYKQYHEQAVNTLTAESVEAFSR